MRAKLPTTKEGALVPPNKRVDRAASGGVGAVRRTARQIRSAVAARRSLVLLPLLMAIFASSLVRSPLWTPHPTGSGSDGSGASVGDPSTAETAEGFARSSAADADVAPPLGSEVAAGPVDASLLAGVQDAAAPVDTPVVAPPSFEAPPATAAAPSRRLRSVGAKEGGIWAVVVGIDDYPGTGHDLKAAVADAREVDGALGAYGVPASRRVLLLDGAATASAIRAGLGWLAGRASSDATAVFFYAGHVRQVSRGADGDSEDLDEAIVASDGAEVLDGEMASDLRRLEARSAWIGMASCYGAGFDDALAPGRVLTAAASEGDLAYENSGLGRSYLVEYMVRQAMRGGQAPGSVQEAFSWARDRIARDYPARIPVLVDRTTSPTRLGYPGGSAPGADRSNPAPPPEAPAPAPPDAPPPPQESPPETPSCTSLVGVTLCSGSSAR
ncbi:MAG: caspase family protein, partial [Acidimicrobiia bacterium]